MRVPTKSVIEKIPYEAWTSRKKCISHFRVFGFLTYAHILEEIMNKLNAKGEICIFLIYNNPFRAYKWYNPIAKKLIITRDFKLQEDKSSNDKVVESYDPFFM